MKFYNPFKPHIAKFDDKFVIRKLTFIGWAYLDRYENSKNPWWEDKFFHKHFTFNYIPECKERFSIHIKKSHEESFYSKL